MLLFTQIPSDRISIRGSGDLIMILGQERIIVGIIHFAKEQHTHNQGTQNAAGSSVALVKASKARRFQACSE
ncbi:hypothetical protein LshimejAT787_1100320 [Lyophyllum shimeji]|uniref:Uncharacterized protein n=1 Tax=Lyophyllum shimeji TaxID=47721 RepID=A0A9P3PVH7_LYOSH|nr:hypothetical protein LshimejAT787_1100320 [Lyophyllum shimeji]